MKDSTKAIRFLDSLRIPEGPRAGQRLKLGPFQRQFVKGALGEGISVAALSIGRGNAKSALSAGLALGSLLGKWDPQPRREIPIGARTRDQAAIAWQFAAGFARSLPEEEQSQLIFRRRSEEHTSELQSLMRTSYAVFCLKKKNTNHI